MIIGRNTVLKREYRLPADICGKERVRYESDVSCNYESIGIFRKGC